MRTITMSVLTVAATLSVAACTTGTEPSGADAVTTTRTAEPTARGAPTPSGTPTRDDADSVTTCAETQTWDTAEETSEPYATNALYLVRVGRHDCYDRVVLDVNGPADVGYAVRYVPVVTADGSGEPMPVAGNAALAVVAHVPPLGFDDGGHQPGRTLADTGDHLYSPGQLTGWRSLRAVRYVGFFEGQTTLAIGVRERVPFRVSSHLDQTDDIRRIVIDIAHDN